MIDTLIRDGDVIAQQFEKVNINDAVINALHRKVTYMSHYHRNFANVQMAML